MNISLLHDDGLATSLRRRVAADDTDIVVTAGFTLAKDADGNTLLECVHVFIYLQCLRLANCPASSRRSSS